MIEMTHKIARITLVLVFGFSLSVFAQTNAVKDTRESVPIDTTFRVGTINMQQVILASNIGRRDFEGLDITFAPKQAELKRLSEELDGLKKQLDAQQTMLNEDARGKLVTLIESKKKTWNGLRRMLKKILGPSAANWSTNS
jgi:Skp family chaperone for outer membrane proteins